MYSSREVDGIGKLGAALLNDYGRGNQFREVVHSELRKDFLVNVLHFFCMEVDKAKGIFEMTERSLNAPASCIEEFEFSRRKSIGRQIGNDGFKGIYGEPETNNAER